MAKAAADAARKATPEPKPEPVEAGPRDYSKYVGRSMVVETPNLADPSKPMQQVTIRDAGATLKGLDERASKFDELAKCLK